jgi:BirA family transcriptional regulator, biotin operon repressor / biotin---[acetyl-CoA-carboxylase] ligase
MMNLKNKKVALDISVIHSHLPLSLHDLPIDLYPQIDSTNTQLKRELSSPNPPMLPRACLAEQQTAGRGQANKQWHSPSGENITLSLAFAYTEPLHRLEGFSLVTALALINALSLSGFTKKIRIKWPNDIFYKNQKLAGILIETITHPSQSTHVIAGIGLNVNMRHIAENDIAYPLNLKEPSINPWTSLALISNHTHDRNKLVAHIIEQFFLYLKLFEQHGLSAFLEQWDAHDFLKGKEVTLENTNNIYKGVAAGINTRGQLLIQTPQGITAHTSGNLRW